MLGCISFGVRAFFLSKTKPKQRRHLFSVSREMNRNVSRCKFDDQSTVYCAARGRAPEEIRRGTSDGAYIEYCSLKAASEHSIFSTLLFLDRPPHSTAPFFFFFSVSLFLPHFLPPCITSIMFRVLFFFFFPFSRTSAAAAAAAARRRQQQQQIAATCAHNLARALLCVERLDEALVSHSYVWGWRSTRCGR